jgi:endonuclease YncB( thermonuclease family)
MRDLQAYPAQAIRSRVLELPREDSVGYGLVTMKLHHVGALVACLLAFVFVLISASPLAAGSDPAARVRATVVKVIDGDTIRVRLDSGAIDKVRLIGMDTPETKDPRKPVQCFGREASAKAAELLDSHEVALESDATQDNRDKYKRLLRYAWLPIQQGYAHEYTYHVPYKYQAQFKAAEREARLHELGFWSGQACGGDTSKPASAGYVPGTALAEAAAPCQAGEIKGNQRSRIYHVPGGAFYEQTRASVRCFKSEADAQAAGFRRSAR